MLSQNDEIFDFYLIFRTQHGDIFIIKEVCILFFSFTGGN